MKVNFAVIKKNQILAASVVLMLAVAGYLNYTYDPNSMFDVELTGVIDESLGDAVFVNSKNIETNIDGLITSTKETNTPKENQTTTTSSKTPKSTEEYFAETKMERDNLLNEQLEMYQKMMENTKLSTEQRNQAQEEIKNIGSKKNSITVIENLIKLKGFDDVVVLINEKSVNVIVKASKEMTDAQIAQIQNIVMREWKITLENVHIMKK